MRHATAPRRSLARVGARQYRPSISTIDIHSRIRDDRRPTSPRTVRAPDSVALLDRPMNGAAMKDEVARRTTGEVVLGPGTLYTSIKRMLDEGLLGEHGLGATHGNACIASHRAAEQPPPPQSGGWSASSRMRARSASSRQSPGRRHDDREAYCLRNARRSLATVSQSLSRGVRRRHSRLDRP